jgi:CRISPR-associated protein Cas2
MIQVVVAYDIVENRRRNKVAKCLEGYGVRVNYSVFECVLKARKLTQMKKELKPLLDPKTDSIRIYRLCKQCIGQTEEMGRGPVGFEHAGLMYV